jgi:GT2 family glycosyltransferase
MRKLSVIVPIYADWDSLNVCIESLINYYSNQTWLEIYLVNDNGPEADFLEEKIQQKITGIQNFSYFRNKKNLGFIKNCNNAVFNIANADTDVLLLNSDTKVTENSIEAMRAVLYSEKNIGLVNPRSNNAGLFGGVSLSVPLDNRYYNQPEKSYSEYLKIKDSLPESIELPVASGFCMMIKREVIDKIGLLDEVYGNGYFDDNDISMRARDAGFLCFAANKSFIFHLGSKSFSDEYRIERSKINQKIFLSRFPDYLSFIQQFPETLTDHQTPTSSRLFQKIIHSGISLVKYAQINGYKNAIKKTFKILSHKISHPFTKHRENPLRLQIWSHEVSNTGAPIVLFDVVDQLKGKIDFENIVYKYPVGVAVNEELRRSLKEKGIDFQEAISFDTHFHNNEIVVLNSSVYPAWVYIKILHNLHTGNIKHLFFYIHEDNEKLAGILRGFRKSIAELLTEDKITIYVPSKNTARQWHKFFGSEKISSSCPVE